MEGFYNLFVGGSSYRTRMTPKFRSRKPFVRRDPKQIRAVIPGSILEVLVRPGQRITCGDPLLVLEAMKMQNDVCAKCDGSIKQVLVKPGQKVSKGDLLVQIE